MSVYEGIEIYSLEDIVINTALGKDVILNGKVYAGNGVGFKSDNFKDRLTLDSRNIYSTQDVVIRADKGKSVIINGTAYPSTTGIARQLGPNSRLYQKGISWYSRDHIVISIPPNKKLIINDVEITPVPDVPSTATVTSLVPNTAVANNGTLVDVNGTGFTPAAVVYVDGSAVQTTYVSAAKVTTNYFGTATTVATYPVGVRKPGELISNTANFTLTSAAAPEPNTVVAAIAGTNGWVIKPAGDVGVGNLSLPGMIYLHGYGGNGNDSANFPNDNWVSQLLHTLVADLKQPCWCPTIASGGWGNQAAIDYLTQFLPSVVNVQMGNDQNRLILIGGSAGGALSFSYAKASGGKVKVFVGLSPVSNITDIHTNNRGPGGGYQDDINVYYPPAWVEATHGANHNPLTIATGSSVDNMAYKTWHGTLDTICVPATISAVVAQLPNASNVLISGADHDSAIRVSDAPAIAAHIRANYPTGAATPTISYMNPNQAQVSSGELVTITGANFVSGCVVQADGIPVQTTYVNPTSVTTTYLGTVATISTIQMTVKNPDNQVSNQSPFSIIAAPAGLPVMSGLASWYDASDASTFSYSSGNNVSQWRDKSGNARHFGTPSPSGGTAQHPSRNGTQNGLTTVVFNGTTHCLQSTSYSLTAPFTVILGYNRFAPGDNPTWLVSHGASGAMKWFFNGYVTLNGAQSNYNSGGIHTEVTEWHPTAAAYYRDLNAKDIYAINIGGSFPHNAPINLGSNWHYTDGVPQNPTSMQAFELIIYNRALTSGERTQMIDYMRTKWGTP